jgi:hypothetical protein
MYDFKNINNTYVGKNLFQNLKQKLIHPILLCNYEYIYGINNLVCNINFSTYHTFTGSSFNSKNLNFKKQDNMV